MWVSYISCAMAFFFFFFLESFFFPLKFPLCKKPRQIKTRFVVLSLWQRVVVCLLANPFTGYSPWRTWALQKSLPLAHGSAQPQRRNTGPLTHSGFTGSLELLQGKTSWAQGLDSLDSSTPVHYCLPATSGMCEVTLLYSLFVWLCAVYHLSKTIGVSNTCATEPCQSLWSAKVGSPWESFGTSPHFDRAHKVHYRPTSLSPTFHPLLDTVS